MKTLEFGKHRRARFWVETLPDVVYPFQSTVMRTFSATAESYEVQRAIAVEIYVPVGPRALYGLLGGRLSPGSSGVLRVEVGISSPSQRLLPDSLAVNSDEVRVGLPAEYAQSVFDGVSLAQSQLITTVAGHLVIDRAAHGAVGSCPLIYRHIAAILVKMLNAKNFSFSEEDLLGVLPASFS
jgi:hypothetical protein